MSNDHRADLARLEEITRRAGAIALSSFRPGAQTSARVYYKNGSSPVTDADLATDAFLKEACAGAFPDCAWFSEETADTPFRLSVPRLVIADPIDGTRAFVSGDARWCVSIAIVEAGRPVAGCVFAPALDECFTASVGGGATHNGERLAIPSKAELATSDALGPKPVIDWLNRLSGTQYRQAARIPSLAYRLAVIARGDAAIGLAGPDSHDWDIAAADLIINEAGGRLFDFAGRQPVYNRPDPVHPALVAAEHGLAQSVVELIEAHGPVR